MMTGKQAGVIITVITILFTVLVTTQGVANETETIVPQKKPFTLNLTAKSKAVQNWMTTRPEALSTWVEETKEYQKDQWSQGKKQTTDNINKIKFFFLGANSED